MEREYGIIIRRNDGEVFNCNADPWRILKVEGIDFPQMELFREAKGEGHGDIIVGKRKQSREIKIVMSMLKYSEQYGRKRQEAIGFFNGNYEFTAEITYINTTRVARECVISASSFPSERDRYNAPLTVMLLSPEADLFALNDDNTTFENITAMWHDTRVYDGKSGALAFGEIKRTNNTAIEYLGSEDTPFQVIVRATGYVDGVTLSAQGRTVKIATKLYDKDVLVIDTEKRMVFKNNKLVANSDYNAMDLYGLVLSYGINKFEVTNEKSTAFKASIKYTGRYGGL